MTSCSQKRTVPDLAGAAPGSLPTKYGAGLLGARTSPLGGLLLGQLFYVHRSVGLLDQGVDWRGCRRVVPAQAHADRQAIGPGRFPVERVYIGPQPLERAIGPVRSALGQEHDEFVSPQPSQHVRLAEGADQDLRGVNQRPVAFRVSAAIVDLLQTIEVQEEQRQPPAVSV